MATDTVPAAVPGPPDQPGRAATGEQPSKGFIASMVAAVEPARPTTFDLNPTPTGASAAGAPDEALDRSAPGVSSADFRDTTSQAAKSGDPAGARHKKNVWKELWLAAATRWAKGGGTANKRLDLAKAKAQAHQVKETRTTTVMKSGGLPVRNTGGSGAGVKKGPDKTGGNSGGKGMSNSSGNGSGGSGRPGSGGSGGGRGTGGTGSNGSSAGSGGRAPKNSGTSGSGASGPRSSTDRSPGKNNGNSKQPAGGSGGNGNGPSGGNGAAGRGAAGSSGTGSGAAGSGGKQGAVGESGKDGAPGTSGTGTAGAKGAGGEPDLTKGPKNSSGTSGQPDAHKARTGKDAGKDTGRHKARDDRTPLQKSRETGHGDGATARRVVDHVKAYVDGARDGWDDEKTKNAKEHERLDKAHDTHQTKDSRPAAALVTEKEDDGVTTDVKPLTVKSIDANTLTLGAGSARTTVGRRELRNFKQYERKLEAKETVLQKIAEACAQLEKQAEQEAKDCQQLAEQAKGVEGGEKLLTKLNKLADAAKSQATEAAELATRAKRAAEMCKVVLTNIQTRYAPLYKAVVDSDETKPAELRFYNDKGTYAPAA
jgi:hypothetical protein